MKLTVEQVYNKLVNDDKILTKKKFKSLYLEL